jgi:hypothetical protein
MPVKLKNTEPTVISWQKISTKITDECAACFPRKLEVHFAGGSIVE